MQDDYFVIDASNMVEEYIDIGDKLQEFASACSMSEFQYIDKNPVSIELPAESGRECQDIIYKQGILLISDRLREFLDEEKIDYLFYKKIVLKKSDIGIEETYWLTIVPKINCMNIEKSEIDEFLNVADMVCIDSDKIGRYQIFKLARVNNLEIIVTKELADKLREEQFEGMHIYELNG